MGILRFDGQPKFPIDLTGQGQNTMLVPAKDVDYLPRTWCLYNANAKDTSKLAENVNSRLAAGTGSSARGAWRVAGVRVEAPVGGDQLATSTAPTGQLKKDVSIRRT